LRVIARLLRGFYDGCAWRKSDAIKILEASESSQTTADVTDETSAEYDQLSLLSMTSARNADCLSVD